MKHIILPIVIVFVITTGFASTQKFYSKFKKICGLQTTIGRIVGGADAALGEFPWIARIGIQIRNNSEPSFFCGGSLISDRHVLSAKHCFYRFLDLPQSNQLIVSLGNHFQSGFSACIGNTCSDPEIYMVGNIKLYNLQQNSFQNDIAILYLTEQVKFSRWITPICLPENIMANSLVGHKAIIIGFGLIDSQLRILSNVLQKVIVMIKERTSCYMYKKPLQPGQLCAGGVIERDSCDGDSGGPLFKLVSGSDGPRYTQVGIVSYGDKLCGSANPAVYTDVNYHMDWIGMQMEK